MGWKCICAKRPCSLVSSSLHASADGRRSLIGPLRPLRRHQWARVRSNWVRQCPACRTGRQWFLGGTGIAHSSRGLWTGCSCRSRAVVLAVTAPAVWRGAWSLVYTTGLQHNLPALPRRCRAAAASACMDGVARTRWRPDIELCRQDCRLRFFSRRAQAAASAFTRVAASLHIGPTMGTKCHAEPLRSVSQGRQYHGHTPSVSRPGGQSRKEDSQRVGNNISWNNTTVCISFHCRRIMSLLSG
jgi:hypothetical protein